MLRWFCKAEYLPDIEGDLVQMYHRRVRDVGPRKARALLMRDVLLLCRPGIIKAPSLPKNQNSIDMLAHDILLSLRSFARHKTTFFINVLGLSTGLTCVIIIGLWVRGELSIDKSHKNDNRLYQIMNNFHVENVITWDITPVALAPALTNEFPEVERAVATNDFFSWLTREGILTANETSIQARGWHGGPEFFNVFTFPLLQGDASRVLTDKNSIVISKDVAAKLFPNAEAVGKSIHWKHPLFEGTYLVSGVFENIPGSSSAKFDFVISIDIVLDHDRWANNWNSFYAQTFVVLKPGSDVDQFNGKLKQFLTTKSPGMEKFSLFAQQYSSRYLHGYYENGIPSGGRIENVRLFSVLAVFIMLIACVNFINLTTAEGSLRMKEIGVKKTMGASQWLMMKRFFVESIMMTLISTTVAIVGALLIIPRINILVGRDLLSGIGTSDLVAIAVIVLLTAVASGAYPAVYLSHFQPVAVLKGKMTDARGQWTFRRCLVVFQFALVVIFLVGIQVIHQQIELTQTEDLGYDRSDVIRFQWKGELFDNWNGLQDGKNNQTFETFLAQLKQLPSVVHATNVKGNILADIPGQSGISWSGQPGERDYLFKSPMIGFDFMETLGIKMMDGRAFSKDLKDDYSKIILNESAVKLMNLKDPVGKKIDMNGGSEIVGIVSDFHYGSLHESVEPMILRCDPTGRTIMVKVRPGQERNAIEEIQKLYAGFLPGYSFNVAYLEDDYRALYAAENSMASLSQLLSALAVVISCLGLFGLATFATDRRMKEISIRKVFGSSSAGIVRVLSREFTVPVLVAIMIGLPISFYFVAEWLSGFSKRIDLSWVYFAFAGAVALIVSWAAVAFKTIAAARISVVKGLRQE